MNIKLSLFLSLHQWTPLLVSVERGNTEALRYLVDKGADINIKDDDGVSEVGYC